MVAKSHLRGRQRFGDLVAAANLTALVTKCQNQSGRHFSLTIDLDGVIPFHDGSDAYALSFEGSGGHESAKGAEGSRIYR